MKTKIITIAGMFLMLTTQGWGVEIRQELYGYPFPLTRPILLPIHPHFIITKDASFRARPERRSFPEVHFSFDSSWVSQEEAYKLLTSLHECGFSGPMQITGYTDAIGSEKQNQNLSQRRAESVANILRKSGYQIHSVEGKGMLYGVGNEKNRKVVISPAILANAQSRAKKYPLQHQEKQP